MNAIVPITELSPFHRNAEVGKKQVRNTFALVRET
jgi:hypothetical protein